MSSVSECCESSHCSLKSYALVTRVIVTKCNFFSFSFSFFRSMHLCPAVRIIWKLSEEDLIRAVTDRFNPKTRSEDVIPRKTSGKTRYY